MPITLSPDGGEGKGEGASGSAVEAHSAITCRGLRPRAGANRARRGNIAAFDIISTLDLCQPDPVARDGASRQVLNKP